MINRFLKAKHWQLFILMFGTPLLFQIVMMGNMFSIINSETVPDPTDLFDMMQYFPIIMILYMGVFFGWFWSIVIGLQSKLPDDLKMKLNRFKIFFFIPLVYLICFSFFFVSFFNGAIHDGTEPNVSAIAGAIGIIIPLHLLSMFGIFHSMYFVAKTIKTVELQKGLRFSDFAGEFFMIWFYFIGIWILQPKINKMVE